MSGVPLVAATVPELLRRRAAAEPDAAAVIDPRGRVLRPGPWLAEAERLARGLVHRGVHAGDFVWLVAAEEDYRDFAVAYLAVLLAGAVAVPVSAGDHAPALRAHPRLRDAFTLSFGSGPGVAFADLAAGPEAPGPLPGIRPDMPAEVSFTSGTEGEPKAVVSYHETLCSTYASEALTSQPQQGSRFLLALPFGHTFAQTIFIDALQTLGAELHVLSGFEPRAFVAELGRRSIAVTFLVPSMLEILMREPELDWAGATALEVACVSGAAVRREALDFLARQVPHATVVNSYCGTEVWPAGTDWVYRPDEPVSAGLPWEGREIRVTGRDGEPLPPGEVGTLSMASLGVLPRTPLEDGGRPERGRWIRTGDLASIGADGRLTIVARAGDVFDCGGVLISPEELEAVLLDHPAITDAAVVPAAHPTLQAIPVALVVTARPVEPADVLAFALDRLGPERAPRSVRLVPAAPGIPRNRAGKVLRREAAALLDRLAGAEFTADHRSVELYLATTLGDLLGAPARPGNFFELGGDSLTALKLCLRLQADHGIRLDARLIREHPELGDLAKAITGTDRLR
ncbi:AMP-binding protein [Amycolatopsis sp., V23-08]|uniref:AMP-binding protein n=1 Tax=Amycolatopsis heterodermiae TaxID=3110235 RepID=A0ABU5R8Q6_9PSEU|nr:AMP-binding protein [Amycolatopsis sp., V23-08]MEA5362617.1 AMP-binding protein [Amycolatopsis sp., V23-08]